MPSEKLYASYTSSKMKAYIHNPQKYRQHFGCGDTVFQGARRQRGHGAISRVAIPLLKSGLKTAAPFLTKLAKGAVKRYIPNPVAQNLANMAVDTVANTINSHSKKKKVLKKRKRHLPVKRHKKRVKNNVFY